jgi:hypothetical protein
MCFFWFFLLIGAALLSVSCVIPEKLTYIRSTLKTEEGLGTGKKNTDLLLSYVSPVARWDMAAQVCDEREVNGYGDRYMPSFMELSLMYGNLYRKGSGNFKSEVYYSGSSKEGCSMSFNFADGSNGIYYTERAKPARAIRRF